MSICSKCYREYILCYKGCDYNGKFISPLPVIGVIVAVASLICSLLMAADALKSFRAKKFWIPCKFFTLNAASLASLTIGMKLLVDLSDPTPSSTDQLAKLSGTAFLCTAMASFMPSIASIDNIELFYNILALAILVMPTILNIYIQLFIGLIVYIDVEHVIVTFFLIFLLAILIFSALSVSTMKNDLERKYRETQEGILSQGRLRTGNPTFEEMEDYVYKSWMMVQTASPQFMLARSATSLASASICFLVFLVLVEAEIRMYLKYPNFDGFSEYRWSTYLILVSQSAGVLVGTIATASRWFVAVNYPMKCSAIYPNGFQIESYWTRNLQRWKRKLLRPKIQKRSNRKIVQAIAFLLTIAMRIQILIVAASKCVRLISISVVKLLCTCYCFCMKSLIRKSDASNLHETETKSHKALELMHCVLQLDGEEKLPVRVLRNICETARDLINKGRKRKPKHIIKLLNRGSTLSSSIQLANLDSQETPKCWTLTIVTLTSISIALNDIRNPIADQLLRTVSEGLIFAGLIEKHLHIEKELANTRYAAEIIWAEVELHHRWLDQDISQLSLKGKTCRETLQSLARIAENKLTDYKNTGDRRNHEENHLDWSIQAVAANSMETITKSLLGDNEGNVDWTHEELFKKLSVTIADLFSSCLANLPRVITEMCCSSAEEAREKNVARAARFLGETEDVLKLLHNHELQNLDADTEAILNR